MVGSPKNAPMNWKENLSEPKLQGSMFQLLDLQGCKNFGGKNIIFFCFAGRELELFHIDISWKTI